MAGRRRYFGGSFLAPFSPLGSDRGSTATAALAIFLMIMARREPAVPTFFQVGRPDPRTGLSRPPWVW